MLEQLISSFERNADTCKADAMSAYMKHHFVFYGIPSPLRKTLQSEVFNSFKLNNQQDLLSAVKFLWDKPERECHYAAIELLAKYKKLLSSESIQFIETLITSNSWWDSVDTLSSQVISPLFKQYPELRYQMIERWKHSDNMWLRRVCIIHQLSYREATDLDMLTELIFINSGSKEFFIQKAIGWALRQYAKTDPEWVLRFVDVNPLKNLSYREAVKNIK
jgi:3-methyladenine DNA glycosylase AlkD